MKYIIVDEEKPKSNVDVYVVTEDGKKGVARYWHTTGKWLTADKSLNSESKVKKWRYADAK